MDAITLIQRWKEQGVRVGLDGDQVRLAVPASLDCGPIQRDLSSSHEAILELLRQATKARGQGRAPVAPESWSIRPSRAQERFFRNHYLAAPGRYLLDRALSLVGPFDLLAAEQAFRHVVAHQDSLRSQFEEHKGEVLLRLNPADFRLIVVHLPAGSAPEDCRPWIEQRFAKRHDLATEPLFQVMIFRLADEQHVLFATVHHIVCDGGSLSVLSKAWQASYRALLRDEPSPDLGVAGRFQDFVFWQSRLLATDQLSGERFWWRKYLYGYKLPFEVVPEQHALPSHRFSFLFDAALTRSLEKHCLGWGCGRFSFLLSSLWALLVKRGAMRDLTIGTTVAHRAFPEWERVIGLFVDLLTIRLQASDTLRFRDLAERMEDAFQDAMDHRHLPFEDVVALCAEDEKPLFQVKLVYHEPSGKRKPLPGTKMRPLAHDLEIETRFVLDIHAGKRGDSMLIEGKTHPRYFSAAQTRQLASEWHQLLREVVRNPVIEV